MSERIFQYALIYSLSYSLSLAGTLCIPLFKTISKQIWLIRLTSLRNQQTETSNWFPAKNNSVFILNLIILSRPIALLKHAEAWINSFTNNHIMIRKEIQWCALVPPVQKQNTVRFM